MKLAEDKYSSSFGLFNGDEEERKYIDFHLMLSRSSDWFFEKDFSLSG
jgi:hypothetical protein